MYLVIPQTQVRFPIGGERVTCRGSKLINSQGKEQLELRLARDQVVLFDTGCGKFVSQMASSKRFPRSFFLFLSWAPSRGTLRVSGEQNSLFFIEPVIEPVIKILRTLLYVKFFFFHIHIQSEDSRQTRLVFNTFYSNNKCHMFS